MQKYAVLKPTVSETINSTFWRQKWWVVILSTILLGGTIAFMWFAFMSAPEAFGPPWAVGSSLPFLVILGLIIRTLWRTSYRHVLWQRYSASRGGSHRFDMAPPTTSALVFQRGINRRITDQVIKPTSLPFTLIGNYIYYYYIILRGEEIPVYPRKVSFFTLTLPRRLPHIILDSTRNNLLKRHSEYGLQLQGVQRLELEGDFINSFSLYVPEGYERDALYIFSPDIMALMVQYAADYDIEIIDDTLYLFAPGHLDITDSARLAELSTIGTALLHKLDKNVRRYADEIIGDRSVNLVASQGSRLQQRAWSVAAITCLIYILFLIFGRQ